MGEEKKKTVSYICLICNGMKTFERNCPQCGKRMADGGRLDDYSGPYSPYREIEHLKLTNGYFDAANHLCVHHTYCGVCGYSAIVQMEEKQT